MQDKDRIAFTGTHPDSLYRVPVSTEEHPGGLMVRWWRVLRWPGALVAVCFALALFIYYVMPDSTETGLAEGNSTVWAGAVGGQFRHRPSIPIHEEFVLGSSPAVLANFTSAVLASGRNEVDFRISDHESKIAEQKKPPPPPPPPSFPSTVTPEVQYGNERRLNPLTTDREPRLVAHAPSDPEDSTLTSPYQHTKGDLAIFVRDYSDSTEYIAQENSTAHTDTAVTGRSQQSESRSNFTSGHSNVFGLSVEESRRLAATTPSYRTRVSPTLPALPRALGEYSVSTTTRRSAHEDDVQCRSTNVNFCRRLLPYDLVQSTPDLNLDLRPRQMDEMIEDFKKHKGLGCSKRMQSFLCHVMEPECTPSTHKPRRPCRKFCIDAIHTCRETENADIPMNSSLIGLLNCNMYPETDCIMPLEPCYESELSCGDGTCFSAARKCDKVKDCPNNVDEKDCHKCNETHWRCALGECVPLRWLCDGYADCPLGDDEFRCSAEPEGFFPHPPPHENKLPEWIQNALPKDGRKFDPLNISPFLDNQGASASHNPIWKSNIFKAMFPEYKLPANEASLGPAKHEVGKGEGESSELLMMSDSSSAARPYPQPSSRAAANFRTRPRQFGRPRARPETHDGTDGEPRLRSGAGSAVGGAGAGYSTDAPDAATAAEGGPVRGSSEDAALFKALIDDLEKIVDAEKWWETSTDSPASPDVGAGGAGAVAGQGGGGGVSDGVRAHSSPCPAGELRCVDGRCIMYSQLCDGRVDCSDRADEDNCRA